MAFTLANARVITAEEIFWGGVEVNGDRIVRVFRGRVPERSDVIDCGGAYLSPGFVDIHVHGCCGAGFLTDDVEEIFRGTRMHALHGTTSIVPTTASSTMENVLTAVRTIARAMNERREGARGDVVDAPLGVDLDDAGRVVAVPVEDGERLGAVDVEELLDALLGRVVAAGDEDVVGGDRADRGALEALGGEDAAGRFEDPLLGTAAALGPARRLLRFTHGFNLRVLTEVVRVV